MGPIYAFTSDGLFLATLFHDVREARLWAMPTAARNMRLNGLTPHDENFWPTVTQTPDGLIYAVDGARTSIVRIDGLEPSAESGRSKLTSRLNNARSGAGLSVAAGSVAAAYRRDGLAPGRSATPPPNVDGKLDDWADAKWVTVDKRGVAAWFNSDSKPYNVEAAIAVSGTGSTRRSAPATRICSKTPAKPPTAPSRPAERTGRDGRR